MYNVDEKSRHQKYIFEIMLNHVFKKTILFQKKVHVIPKNVSYN